MLGSHRSAGAAAGKRRFFQFGLRTLLVATTVFSVWLGLYVHRVRRQKAAVAAIRDYGGWAHYDFQEVPPGSLKFDPQAQPKLPKWLVESLGEDFFYDAIEVNLVYNDDSGKREDNANVSGEALQHLEALPDVRQLLIFEGQATDEGLKYAGRLRNLERILMWDASEVTDVGVSHLAALKHLKAIHLTGSQITDESLKTLSGLPELEVMSLQNNRFTDAGLAHLQGKQKLRTLWVGAGGSDISDAGMPYVASLVNLEVLELQGTKVTSKGLACLTRLKKLKSLVIGSSRVANSQAFKQALPNCKVD